MVCQNRYKKVRFVALQAQTLTKACPGSAAAGRSNGRRSFQSSLKSPEEAFKRENSAALRAPKTKWMKTRTTITYLAFSLFDLISQQIQVLKRTP